MLLLTVDLIYMGRLFGAKMMIIGIFEDTCDAKGEGDSARDAKLQGAHCAPCTALVAQGALCTALGALYALYWVHSALHMVHPSFLETCNRCW